MERVRAGSMTHNYKRHAPHGVSAVNVLQGKVVVCSIPAWQGHSH